jgi:23S rRNA (cytosine1962-C5)-methyltransferase
MPEIVIKTGREKSLLRHHPWVFSGAVARINGKPCLGETVNVVSSKGDFLARAAINHNSSIIARVWTWDEKEQVDSSLLSEKLKKAIESRRSITNFLQTNAMRLVHGESDGLPGLILDQYDDTFVVQFLTAGIEYWKNDLVEIILRNTNASVLYERSDVDVRQIEGLELKKGVLHGQFSGKNIEFVENNVKYLVDIANGHKTGFYLDQRDNRLLVRNISNGLKILDCFCYTGGFTINCLLGNSVSVTMVDSSSSVLRLARENITLNQILTDRITVIEQDVFKYLRYLRDIGETYDMVILDPPKFAPTATQAQHAARGYKDINLLALKLLNPRGFLVTFSCSGGVSEDLFQKIVCGAAFDAKVDAVIIKRLHQACDHPVALNFPEGAYLKGFIIQKQ